MEKMQIAIAGISEMRWRGNGTTTTSSGNLVMLSGTNDGGRSGVGIYMSKQYKQTLISSDRIIIARFRCNARHITIVQCYAPTEDASDDFKDDFYNDF
ncbi:craniofacial development protein 2-like [Drosophila bipectinata]|uniref:craniofacial development protein 2-like n=1 Tax=Drosophila bipectinata TaxID=42026 RepID=UPI0038B3FCB2